MSNRINLQKDLEAVLGSENVYFQPPSGIRMLYPAVVYSLNRISATYAGNKIYNERKSYTLIIMDANPNSDILAIILISFTHISFDRMYIKDNLYHWVCTLFY